MEHFSKEVYSYKQIFGHSCPFIGKKSTQIINLKNIKICEKMFFFCVIKQKLSPTDQLVLFVVTVKSFIYQTNKI